MSRYGFRLKNREIIDNIRSPYIYEFNLARNLALLSNNPAVIRYFYQIDAPKFMKDQWLQMEVTDKFLAQYRPGQAFAYFGICPMIVQAKVNLLASTGFECQSDDKEIDEILNKAKDDARLEQKFADGVYWESGIGDFAYRLSYNPKVSKDPIITVIEPQHLEVNYAGGKIKSFVIKEVSGEDSNYELHELWYRNTDNKAMKYLKYPDKDIVVQQIGMLAMHANFRNVEDIYNIPSFVSMQATHPESVCTAIATYLYYTLLINNKFGIKDYNDLFIKSWCNYYENWGARIIMFRMNGNKWKDSFSGVLLDLD